MSYMAVALGGLTVAGGIAATAFWYARRSLAADAARREVGGRRFRQEALRWKPASRDDVLDIEALAEACGLTSVEARCEAAELFRDFIRQALADNVVTDQEKARADSLAVLLDIDDETRAAVIRSERRAAARRIEEAKWTSEREELERRRMAITRESIQPAGSSRIQTSCQETSPEGRRAQKPRPPVSGDPVGARLAVLDEHWPRDERGIPSWAGTSNWNLQVAGESHYQSELLSLVGGEKRRGGANKLVEAVLLPDPENQFDPHAVKVTIRGKTVGYLPRSTARTWRKSQSESYIPEGCVKVMALICGGWDRGDGDEGHFGVKLDFSLIRNRNAINRSVEAAVQS
jgi:hypothetical protein